jgi:hypothetical protein
MHDLSSDSFKDIDFNDENRIEENFTPRFTQKIYILIPIKLV